VRIAVKVLEVGGRRWMVNAAFARPESPKLLTVVCSGEQRRNLTMVLTEDEYNNLDYHWFEDVGPAEHQPAILPEVVMIPGGVRR
jgi:hypothetical protein